MKQRVFPIILAFCLCISSHSAAYAFQKTPLQPEEALPKESPVGEESDDSISPLPQGTPLQPEEAQPQESPVKVLPSVNVSPTPQKTPSRPKEVLPQALQGGRVTRDGTFSDPTEVYEAMIALKEQDKYREGATWTNEEPYSDLKGYYRWKGGPLDGVNIAAVGCVAFAFELSDAAFGTSEARMYAADGFSFEDIKVGDILRVNNDAHTVIVLEVSDAYVVVAEGNISTGDHQGKVHWGRVISKDEVMNITSHYITRYPEGYVPPDDPGANESFANGSLEGGLVWNLTNVGTLTISGQGAMPDFGSAENQPWSACGSKVRKVVIEEGVTSIGDNAFMNCPVISAEIPSSVKTIGDSAFQGCQNLSSVAVCEGVETIGQNVFRACTNLTSISLPASIGEVGDAAFFECTKMKSAEFASGGIQVKMGNSIFARCYELTSVTLPQNINCIGEGMFVNCKLLTEVEIPQGAESIGATAFASCPGLTTVIIPDSVTTIGAGAFSNCFVKDIYFTGTEGQWNSINKIDDTASTATVHYNYIPVPRPTPNPDGDNNTGNNPGGDQSGDNAGNTSGGNPTDSSSSDNVSSNMETDSDSAEGNQGASSIINSGIKAVVETWKPTTPDERKRYACVGREAVWYTPSKDNAYQVVIENAMQGPMCFKSFEAVLGDYTIGRTYNIYSQSDNTYSMDKEIEVTIKIPSDIYKENREYKMICVTKGGQPIIYNDSDNNPETITIKTNKFYAYALIYK